MTIKITIDRFENNIAILKTKDGSTINWPKDKLPQDSSEGSVLMFNLLNADEVEKDKKELAKNILNEILDIKKE